MRARLLFLLLFLGCKDSTGVDAKLSLVRREYAAWQASGLTSYEYVHRQDCFCDPVTLKPLTIRVVNNKVVAVFDSAGLSLPSQYVNILPTIDDIFKRVIDQLEQGSYKFTRLSFDAALHYPNDIGGNIEYAADAGYVLTVQGLKSYQPPILPVAQRDTSLPVQTDSLLYHMVGNSNFLNSTVHFMVRNKSSQQITWEHCRGEYPIAVQKQVGNTWVGAYIYPTLACGGAFINIPPGGNYADSLVLYSFPSGHVMPNFYSPNDLQQVYRMVLPLGLTSNSFVLDDPRF